MAENFERLQNSLAQYRNRPVILFFSGGFDSSALLGSAVKVGLNILPVWIDNGLNRAKYEDIETQAKLLGALRLARLDLNLNPDALKNDKERCYFCKRQNILAGLERFGQDALYFDGTNAEDLNQYRPGLRVKKELPVLSPLLEAGLGKQQTRDIAFHCGASEKIAHLESCLATRVNYGIPLTPEIIAVLREIELAVIEAFQDFHVRCRLDDRDHLRIELSQSNGQQIWDAPETKAGILRLGKNICRTVSIDLEPSRPNIFDQ